MPLNHDRQSALDLAVDQALYQRALFHRLFQVMPSGQTFGFFPRQPGFTVTVLEHFDGNRNIIAGLDLDFASVVLEFVSAAIKLSDLSPALTTTKFWSTRTTSAVMTSPARISCRERLSSNSAAKLFSSMPEAGVWGAVFMKMDRDSENPLQKTVGLK